MLSTILFVLTVAQPASDRIIKIESPAKWFLGDVLVRLPRA